MKRILYIQYTNPAAYPPLQHSSRVLADDKWDVLFLGTGALGSDSLKFPTYPSITVRQLAFCPPGWRQKLHYVWFCLWVLVCTLRWQPQWVYASDLLVCPIAVLLSGLPGIRLIYHEHDSPSHASASAFLRLCFMARQRLAARAAICILPNQQRAHRFEQETGNQQKALCVWNCPALAEVTPPRLFNSSDRLRVLYHGSITPDRLPLTVLHALALLPETVTLRVIGYTTTGYLNYVQHLTTVAAELGISDRIEFTGAMPRYELLKYCQQDDVGLSLMPMSSQDINLHWMTGASNKAFDYMACGLALLVSNLPDWQAMYVEAGYGLSCNPDATESIATVLKWYLENPEQRQKMGEKGRRQILTEWNYDHQFTVVQQEMER